MPLKLTCKHCGALMYESSGEFKRYSCKPKLSNHLDLCIPEIIDRKLHFKCPSCKRTISSSDLESWTIKLKDAKTGKLLIQCMHALLSIKGDLRNIEEAEQ